jgi:uncharacterized ferritin-like protein (DUF455 family)
LEIDRQPESGTVERWAFDLIQADTLEGKLNPGAPPELWEAAPVERRLSKPGRPPELRLAGRSAKTPKPGSLHRVENRALLCHAFLHHEVQAAELLCWALLAFPQTPKEFRAGLLSIALDELSHVALYHQHLTTLGYELTDFPVRDWFWQRIPTCERPEQFCALMGMGLEGSNLDHAINFAQRFRSAGDEAGAVIQERIAHEEVAHVRFAVRWFEFWTKSSEFERWKSELPAPLTPVLFRGKPMAHKLRIAAGMSKSFIEELAAFDAPLT